MSEAEKKSKTTWTPRQEQAICAPGGVLVSAAAGSGKTAVLAERCAYFVCDAPKLCNVNELLVVTFTESAAAEMKSRIRKALRRRQDQRPGDRRLARQMALVEHANVSTVHGFCARLLRQNFHLVGLDPAFDILDEDEAVLLRLEVADEVFGARYDKDEDGDFQRLIDRYGNGDDQQLMRRIISAHAMLGSLKDPSGWIAQASEDAREAAATGMQSRWGVAFLQQVKEQLAALSRQCADGAAFLARMGKDFAPYLKLIKELAAVVGHWERVFEKDGLDMLASEFRNFVEDMPRAPTISGKAANKDIAKGAIDGVKKAIKDGPLAELLALDSASWQDTMRQTAPMADVFLSLLGEFGEAYKLAKQSARALDFADLESLALKVLQNNPAVVASLHEQFRHVLVDEYQDINQIQDAILDLVRGGEGNKAQDNLFCVGDVKQSIFRFRLADPQRFLRRLKDNPEKAVYLQENFRSRAPLLEAINATFERLMTSAAAEIEYDDSHRLKPGRSFPEPKDASQFSGAPITLHLLSSKAGGHAGEEDENSPELERAEYEAILLAKEIRRMMGADGSERKQICKWDSDGKPFFAPIEYGDIAILLRSMRFKADIFADVLRGFEIPVHNEGGGGFFEATEIRDLVCLLQILDNARQDIPLAAVLRSPLAALENADDCLARIRLKYADGKNPIAFHEAARKYAAEQSDELSNRLGGFFEQLAGWRDQANKRPVAELIWNIYQESGYLAFCAGLPDGQQRVANLIYLHERAAQFGTFLRQDLHRFLRFLENLREERDLGRPSTSTGAQQAVRIMSIHRSKGLEFPVVMLADLGKKHNFSDTSGAILLDRASGLGMDVVDEARLIRYPSLASVVVRESIHRQMIAEELRLLYVAMTRAKEHLVLVGSCTESKLESWKKLWLSHAGAMPADEVLAGKTSLDWLGPVAAMGANSSAIKTEWHSSEELSGWKNPQYHRPAFSAEQTAMASLAKLTADALVSPAAENVRQRFETVYPFDAFAAQPAALSVTSLAKSGEEESAEYSRSWESGSPARKLDLPKFYVEAGEPKATDVGTATHLVLEHWDYSHGGGEEEIKRQIGDLVHRNLISPGQAEMVDQRAIAWFLQSKIGAILAEKGGQMQREVPFALAVAPDAAAKTDDPLDQVMVRGRIDLLFPFEDGLAIVDYKTDKAAGAQLQERVNLYAKQMRYYREAIEKVAGRKISAIFLAFLTPRKIEQIAGNNAK